MSDTLIFLAWLAKATTLLLLAMGITIGLRRAPAGARYLVWLATLVALLLVPAVSSWSPIPLPILPGLAPSSTTVAPPVPSAPLTVGVTPSPRSTAPPTADRAATVTNAAPQTLAPSTILLILWAAVGALLLVWLLLGALAVRRIVRGARVLADEAWLSPMYDVADRLDLGHAPRLVMSSAIEMPFACGILRPTIVLPSSAEQWSAERRRCVLFHELAHVRRRDLIGHTLGRVACAFYWFHPMVWSAAKNLRAESERACDDLVLGCGGARASDYANHLLEIVTAVRRQGAPATALPMADKREFEGRMLAILDPAIRRATPSRVQTLLLTAGLGALSLTIAAVAPARRIAAPVPTSQAATVPPSTMQDSAVTSSPKAPLPAGQVATEKPAVMSNTVTSRKDTPLVANWQTTVSRVISTKVDSVLSELTHLSSAVRGPQDSRRQQSVDTALLGRILRTDKDAVVRKSAAWVLQGHRDGIPLLIERLRQDEDADVREMSVWALAGMGSTDVAAALTESLKRDKSDEVRATSAWGLGLMRGRVDVAALEAALSDASAEVRQRALWALGHQGLTSAPPGVVTLLKDDAEDVRLMAAWVLGVILDRSTVPALREAFLKERHSEILQAELRALMFMGDRSQSVIDRAMAHEDPEIRARGVRLIAGQGPGVWPWPWPWPDPRPEP